MQIKIKLPNPNQFRNEYSVYFDQLELAVYHARKSWEKINEAVDNPEDLSIYHSLEGIDRADSLIKKFEEADKSNNKDRDEEWFDLLEEVEINISY